MSALFVYRTSTKYWTPISDFSGQAGELCRTAGYGSMFSVLEYVVLLRYMKDVACRRYTMYRTSTKYWFSVCEFTGLVDAFFGGCRYRFNVVCCYGTVAARILDRIKTQNLYPELQKQRPSN